MSVQLPEDVTIACVDQVWVGTSVLAFREEAGSVFRIMQQSKIVLGRPIKQFLFLFLNFYLRIIRMSLQKLKLYHKSLFYKKELSKNKNDPKVWNLIRSLNPPNKKSSNNTNQEVNLNPNLTEKFNDFFCTIGEKLANMIPTKNPLNFKTFLKHQFLPFFFLNLQTFMKSLTCYALLK